MKILQSLLTLGLLASNAKLAEATYTCMSGETMFTLMYYTDATGTSQQTTSYMDFAGRLSYVKSVAVLSTGTSCVVVEYQINANGNISDSNNNYTVCYDTVKTATQNMMSNLCAYSIANNVNADLVNGVCKNY